MATNTDYRCSGNVTSQVNPNITPQLNKWENTANVVGNTSLYATSSYTLTKTPTHYKETTTYDKNGKKVIKKVADKWKDVYVKPWTLASSDFNFDLPSNAKIKSITFKVRIRCDWNMDVPAPIGNFRVGTDLYNKKFDNTPTKGLTTGWNDGCYLIVPTKKLTSKFDTIYYKMEEDEIKRAKHSPSNINANLMGIDLIFQDATFKKTDKEGKASGNVYVEWIQCRVEYDIPKYEVSITNPIETALNLTKNYKVDFNGTESSPYRTGTDNDFALIVHCKNKSSAKGSGTRTINVDVPWGTDVKSYVASDGTYSNGVWTVPVGSNIDYTLELTLTPHKTGLNDFNASISSQSASYYYYVLQSDDFDGYGDITLYANGEFVKRVNSCLGIDIHNESEDTSLTVTVNANKSILYTNFSLGSNTSNGVSLTSQTTNTATLTVPVGESFINLNYCFHPTSTDDITFTVTSSDSSKTESKTFKVSASPIYNFSELVRPQTIKFNNHRVVSEVNTGSSIIPCVSDELDSIMVMSDCTLGADILEDLDYIGCIPLEQTHFNPKSTFKDTLINSTYKNKRYMGKKLATDEDITLNVRLHPQQVTTLQGLIEMDKPIPINTNHKSFEGDSLNHRGWAEVYAVKTEYTNPHWYKCDIDVKYLTHNLNTRFKIDKGAKVSDYPIPLLMTESHSNGENLSEDDSYFETDTDGTFYYYENESYTYEFLDENGDTVTDLGDSTTLTYTDYEGTSHTLTGLDDVVEFLEDELNLEVVTPVLNQTIKIKATTDIENIKKNSFNIDNSQHIRVTTANPLTSTSQVKFDWSSILMTEDRENHVSRIVRLIEKDSKATVFEYEYDDLTINDDNIKAYVIYRLLEDGSLNSYPVSKPITFRYNPSDVTLDGDVVDVGEEDVIQTGEAHFGSTINLTINNGTLTIVDEGFNGREVSITEKIGDGEYYYQVEWVNKNMDAETSDVECVFDFNVQDTFLTTTYSDKMGNLVISPFPVTDKDVVFTRNAEEGTIYYYNDDGEEFSYLINPYYQYMNGTDLVTSDGVSIFDLNYGYEIVYIQNGLVRLGFNRLTGSLYLGKWDMQSQQYITTHRLHLEKFDDINVNNISDDKIEIQASDCIFTIYRGHPYIKIKHELEDIPIDTVFNKVWAEQVGDDAGVDLPAYWELDNDKNLLDECVGGSTGLKSSCIDVDTSERDLTSTTLAWSSFPSDIMVGDVKFTLDMTSLSSYSDEISIDGGECSFGLYSFELETSNTPVAINNLTANSPIQTGDYSEIFARVVDYGNNGVGGQTVHFYEVFTPSISMSASANVLQSTDTIELYAKVKDEDGSIVSGEKVYFFERIE